MTPQSMAEDCIRANIHVPLRHLPELKHEERSARHLLPPYKTAEEQPGLPILVFVHGGGFAFGSGDSDLHGPEYLVREGVLVITFNYR